MSHSMLRLSLALLIGFRHIFLAFSKYIWNSFKKSILISISIFHSFKFSNCVCCWCRCDINYIQPNIMSTQTEHMFSRCTQSSFPLVNKVSDGLLTKTMCLPPNSNFQCVKWNMFGWLRTELRQYFPPFLFTFMAIALLWWNLTQANENVKNIEYIQFHMGYEHSVDLIIRF